MFRPYVSLYIASLSPPVILEEEESFLQYIIEPKREKGKKKGLLRELNPSPTHFISSAKQSGFLSRSINSTTKLRSRISPRRKKITIHILPCGRYEK